MERKKLVRDIMLRKNRVMYHKGRRVSLEELEIPLRKGIMFRVMTTEGKNVTFEYIWKFMAVYGKKHNINPHIMCEELLKKGGEND